MQHSLFRYFDKESYAQDFVEGQIFGHNLQYYVNLEDGQVRGDSNDGSLVHRPLHGLEINNLTQNTNFTISDAEFNSRANIEDIYALCMSESLTTKMVESFKATCCVEIKNKRRFLQSVRSALVGSGNAAYIGRVTYYHPSHAPLARWAVPEQICLWKDQNYRWQGEYRVAFGMPEHFAVENVTTTISPTKPVVEASQNGIEKNMTFRIGDIRSISTMHKFK